MQPYDFTYADIDTKYQPQKVNVDEIFQSWGWSLQKISYECGMLGEGDVGLYRLVWKMKEFLFFISGPLGLKRQGNTDV